MYFEWQSEPKPNATNEDRAKSLQIVYYLLYTFHTYTLRGILVLLQPFHLMLYHSTVEYVMHFVHVCYECLPILFFIHCTYQAFVVYLFHVFIFLVSCLAVCVCVRVCAFASYSGFRFLCVRVSSVLRVLPYLQQLPVQCTPWTRTDSSSYRINTMLSHLLLGVPFPSGFRTIVHDFRMKNEFEYWTSYFIFIGKCRWNANTLYLQYGLASNFIQCGFPCNRTPGHEQKKIIQI